jgi:type I restriction enzyme, S subunit
MRKYPKYKASGVEWFNEIPISWGFEKIKFQGKVVSGSTPETSKPEFWGGEIVWATPVDFGADSQKYIYTSGRKITKDGLNNIGGKLVPKGAVVISSRAPIGLVGLAGVDLVTNQGCKSIIPKKVIGEYLFFCLKEFSIVLENLGNETIFAELSIGTLKNFTLPVPTIPEQHAIVRFLDYKTGQIDRFIASRQKQIELLKEQLHFKINEAITKGINQKAKFKPTDIKYVPEIPEHWDIRKFKGLTSILTCGVAATPEYIEESEGVAFLSAQNCRPFAMDLSKYSYIKPALHKQLTKYKKPQKGDVLVTRVGAGIGQACIIDTDLEFSVYVSLTHIRPNQEILSEYIVYFFNTEYCYQLNHEGTVVGGGQGNLNVKNVERYRIPLPPIDEQKEIIAYLDNYRIEMDSLISKYQKQIDLMQEYRTSLISQAVTGKIDVREWQPKARKYQTEEIPVSIAAEN